MQHPLREDISSKNTYAWQAFCVFFLKKISTILSASYEMQTLSIVLIL